MSEEVESSNFDNFENRDNLIVNKLSNETDLIESDTEENTTDENTKNNVNYEIENDTKDLIREIEDDGIYNDWTDLVDKVFSSKARDLHKLKQIAKKNLGKRTLTKMNNVRLLENSEDEEIKGILKDLSTIKNKQDLVDMIENDYHIIQEENLPYSNFLDVIDELSRSTEPFLPYFL
tara:strand:- start:586 stop:1116 length:531 start_codon:yes stop_codon:yes gene_type:complete